MAIPKLLLYNLVLNYYFDFSLLLQQQLLRFHFLLLEFLLLPVQFQLVILFLLLIKQMLPFLFLLFVLLIQFVWFVHSSYFLQFVVYFSQLLLFHFRWQFFLARFVPLIAYHTLQALLTNNILK